MHKIKLLLNGSLQTSVVDILDDNPWEEILDDSPEEWKVVLQKFRDVRVSHGPD